MSSKQKRIRREDITTAKIRLSEAYMEVFRRIEENTNNRGHLCEKFKFYSPGGYICVFCDLPTQAPKNYRYIAAIYALRNLFGKDIPVLAEEIALCRLIGSENFNRWLSGIFKLAIVTKYEVACPDCGSISKIPYTKKAVVKTMLLDHKITMYCPTSEHKFYVTHDFLKDNSAYLRRYNQLKSSMAGKTTLPKDDIPRPYTDKIRIVYE